MADYEFLLVKTAKRITAVSLLLFMAFAFSGCSIGSIEKQLGRQSTETENVDKTDSDNDGLYDYEERKLGTDTGKKDTDGDGLSDYDEVRTWHTDPNKADTDGDGRSDGEEVKMGYDPLGSGQLDTDLDGLGNVDEKNFGTDPNNSDSDGDGIGDKAEFDARQQTPLDE